MLIKDAAAIDKNFATPKGVIKEDVIYHNATELDVYGVTYEDGVYRRMSYDVAKRISENVALISSECAGGRVRFVTDSPYIAIYVKYRSVAKVPNYSFSATLGFDLYAGKRYAGCFVPPIDTTDVLESVLDVNAEGAQEYTLNFPVCSEISELYIGVKKGCTIGKAPAYTIKTPVVFYGSSTTQGACASRPGNTYENIISRALDCDYVNLGFWGNAMGEEEMAKYIAGLTMSAFVYDYDYNAPDAAHLEATHEKMFKIIRERNPDLPIIILSAPKYYLDETDKKRVAVIEKTYQNAIKSGDKSVCFITGAEMLKDVKDTALADNVHPGDSGFISIAQFVGDALKAFVQNK
ncbi:MAG: hypothetical protein E7352_00185 [Clostridiales bacterium]|nr:hypothetical protein [Clostridiales bacterium]